MLYKAFAVKFVADIIAPQVAALTFTLAALPDCRDPSRPVIPVSFATHKDS